MAGQVSKSQFKARALEYFREVEKSGVPLIITDHGKPTLEIRKIASIDTQPPADLQGSVLWYDRPFDPVDEDEWDVLK